METGERAGIRTDERAELLRLRRENALLKEEREILRKATQFFRTHERDVTNCYQFVAD